MIKVTVPFDEQDIVDKLLNRAKIRRQLPRGEPDRIADLCEAAAQEIINLRSKLSLKDSK